MNIRVTTWTILVLVVTAVSAYVDDDQFLQDYKIHTNNVAVEQLPPLDPADHSFPKTPSVPLVPTCVDEGYFRDPFNCGKFYRCSSPRAVPAAFYCQIGLIFDTNTNSCVHPDSCVDHCGNCYTNG